MHRADEIVLSHRMLQALISAATARTTSTVTATDIRRIQMDQPSREPCRRFAV